MQEKKPLLRRMMERMRPERAKPDIAPSGKLESPAERQQKLDNALIEAARNSRTEDAERLIKAGADVAAKDFDGYTALMKAAYKKNELLCRRIIDACKEAGKDVKGLIASANRSGDTALFGAAKSGSIEICSFLIREYANAGGNAKELIAAKDDVGRTVLFNAAQEAPTETCAFLIEACRKSGGDVAAFIGAKDKHYDTALNRSTNSRGGSTCALIIDELIKAKVDIKALIAENQSTSLHSTPYYGISTALHWAAYYENTEACALIINAYRESGGNVIELISRKDNDGWTALHHATKHGNLQLCELLIYEYAEAGGNPRRLITARNKDGTTPMRNAENGKFENYEKTVRFFDLTELVVDIAGSSFLKPFRDCVSGGG